MNIGKLGSSGALMSDTCNGARKTRRLIVEKVHEDAEALRKYKYDGIRVLEVDCWNHLRNMWLGGMTKALPTLLVKSIRRELDDIYSRLMFFTSIESVVRATNKEFSMCANYYTGHKELLHERVETYQPGALILHVERASELYMSKKLVIIVIHISE